MDGNSKSWHAAGARTERGRWRRPKPTRGEGALNRQHDNRGSGPQALRLRQALRRRGSHPARLRGLARHKAKSTVPQH